MQFVFRVGGMVECHERPFGADVAGVTGAAEVSFVLIVLEVARDTGSVELIDEGVLAVAVAAAQFAMVSLQNKFRVPGMIEARIVPAGRAVTVLALLAAPAFVRIVIGMT